MNVASMAARKARPIEPDDPMPWGKHKGIPINEVPPDYLRWALGNMDACNPDHERYWPEYTDVLQAIVGAQPRSEPRSLSIIDLCTRLRRDRITLSAQGPNIVPSGPLDEDLQRSITAHGHTLLAVLERSTNKINGAAQVIQFTEIRFLIKRWFGAMSQRFHPDRGGSAESQIAVNECYKSLVQIITEWESKR